MTIEPRCPICFAPLPCAEHDAVHRMSSPQTPSMDDKHIKDFGPKKPTKLKAIK